MKVINEGIAIGYSYHLTKGAIKLKQYSDNPNKEQQIFLKAQKKCLDELFSLEEITTGDIQDIIRVHRLFIADNSVSDEVLTRINDLKETAGYAYQSVVNNHIKLLANNGNSYLKERQYDLVDIREQMLNVMYDNNYKQTFLAPTILIVDYLYPSLVLNLPPKVKAIIARDGGHLTHAAILAKEKGIPYVVMPELDLENDQLLILNTEKESLIINPCSEKLSLYEKTSPVRSLKQFANYQPSEFNLYLNLSSLINLNSKLIPYIAGVGLFRTEHLVLNNNEFPFKEKQIEIYQKLLATFYPKPVKIRLFDFHGDKRPYFLKENSAEYFSLNGPLKQIYHNQLQALLIANEVYGNLEIIIPMINNRQEYDRVLNYLKTYKKENYLIRDLPKLGIMLETKKAYEELQQFQEVDFINVGTNDLGAELLGIERDIISDFFANYQLLLEPLQRIADFCARNKIECLICGDIASHKKSFVELLEKGFKTFSIASGFFIEALEEIASYNRKRTKTKKN